MLSVRAASGPIPNRLIPLTPRRYWETTSPIAAPVQPRFAELTTAAVRTWLAEKWTNLTVSKVYASDPLLPIFDIPYRFTVYSPNWRQYQKPLAQVRADLANAQTVVVGDLHASFLKLAEVLVAANLIEMPEEKAKEFVRFTQQLEEILTPISQAFRRKDQNLAKFLFYRKMEKLRDLETQLCHTLLSMRWIGGTRRLILLGDVLNDRWGLDKVMMALLRHLTEPPNSAGILWLASNHDMGVFNNHDTPPEEHLSYVLTRLLHYDTWETVVLPQYKAYLQKSQLMHYLPKTQTLLTHAPIGPQNIREMMDALSWKTPYERINTKTGTLPLFIKAANRYYQRYANGSPAIDRREQYANFPMHQFVWQRYDDNPQSFTPPFYRQGVTALCHGHDGNLEKGKLTALFSVDRFWRPSDYTVINLNQRIRMFPGEPIGPQESLPLYIE